MPGDSSLVVVEAGVARADVLVPVPDCDCDERMGIIRGALVK
jgi:hypothetical protein